MRRPTFLSAVHRSAVIGAVLCTVFAADAFCVDPSNDMQVDNPRAFGHFLGDRVIRHIQLTVPRPYALAKNGLPRTERIGTWMELTAVSARSAPGLRGTRYRIDLVYQVVNSPVQPQIAVLPPVSLKFLAPGKTFERTLEEWPIALAPLTPGGVRTGLEEMRPARPPRPIAATLAETRLVLYCTGAAAVFAYLAFVRFGLPGLARRNGPFARAHRTIQLLARRPRSVENFQIALRAVHRAFDQTAGLRVFPEHLDEFLIRHARFRAVREAAQRFFEVSRSEFFGKGAPGELQRLDWLLELCAQCRAREREVSIATPARFRTELPRSASDTQRAR